MHSPLPAKLEAIRNWPVPHCLRDVRAFFGLASYYHQFVKGFATTTEPFTRFTHKMARFEWTEEAQRAFDALEKAVVEVTSLAFLYQHEPCILRYDRRCYFNVRSKADMSQHNLPHGTDN